MARPWSRRRAPDSRRSAHPFAALAGSSPGLGLLPPWLSRATTHRRGDGTEPAANTAHHYDPSNAVATFRPDDGALPGVRFAQEDPRQFRGLEPAAAQDRLGPTCRRRLLAPWSASRSVSGWGSPRSRQRSEARTSMHDHAWSNSANFNAERIAAAGLTDQVRVELLDYRDIEETQRRRLVASR